MPFCFTGMGIFRAWTETVYANGSLSFPAQQSLLSGFAAFNVTLAVVLLAIAFTAKRIAPFYGKKAPVPLSGACLIASCCLNFYSLYYPEHAALIGVPAMVAGAVGIALIILLWSELFGCLNPLRVGLYYAGGLVVGSLILWLFKGLAIPWLWACTCCVPIVSLACLKRAYAVLPDNERPHVGWGSFSFPWKPIAVIALYSLAYGLSVKTVSGITGIHSGFGALAAAVLVYSAVCFKRGTFEFSILYKIALPLLLVSLLPFRWVGGIGSAVAGFCALASYTLCLIVIMVILSGIVYKYGVNALWLFGIERAVRLLAVQLGITVADLAEVTAEITPLQVSVIAAMGASVVVATMLLLSEKQLTAPWGAVLREKIPEEREELAGKNRLGTKCYELGGQYGLTPREEEIMLLLAQGKKPAQIEKELFVANSTVKTHMKHIYQKLDIHSRAEMFELLGVGSEERATPTSLR
ncbi:helix-turn-helix transcriptional regulator [Curtanaerobium respiraculi]|uniref:helix-turn-helix transcriptional regulator n=1 Tax=Curtanaerobium respiraculi TaxID=2949669 RepID=UPI0024B3BA80|nr:helix-turn-helix transcriptional regulator [Curtanaerobium respiraculi]